MALEHGQTQMPCGVEFDTLVAQITDHAPPPDPAHQADCPYCQTALRSLRRAWGDVQILAQTLVTVPPGLTARVMTRIRTIARHAAGNIILAGSRGHTQISHAEPDWV